MRLKQACLAACPIIPESVAVPLYPCICLSAHKAAKGGIVIGDRVDLPRQLEKWMEEVMSEDMIIILIKMYRATI